MENEGIYTCVANNKAGSLDIDVQLIVLGLFAYKNFLQQNSQNYILIRIALYFLSFQFFIYSQFFHLFSIFFENIYKIFFLFYLIFIDYFRLLFADHFIAIASSFVNNFLISENEQMRKTCKMFILKFCY